MLSIERAFREVIEEWFSFELPSIITRDLDYTFSDNALAILGPRRAGKTYFLFQITRDLMGSG
ncbi:hypothetical protein [Vulcanisaeta thermophila]|uniref:hypothetical protein n=1 Tax=Vulcanisaeta thermophila TaxID=867917 RepID=UPI00192E3152|nr:hypothetical protein [Vulcanisaeta thermophila]